MIMNRRMIIKRLVVMNEWLVMYRWLIYRWVVNSSRWIVLFLRMIMIIEETILRRMPRITDLINDGTIYRFLVIISLFDSFNLRYSNIVRHLFRNHFLFLTQHCFYWLFAIEYFEDLTPSRGFLRQYNL